MNKKLRPPALADRFFEWYCNDDLLEGIQGDLHERYYEYLNRFGKQRANILYWINVIRFINRYTLRRSDKQKYHHNHTAMFRNNLISSYRFLKNHKVYALINIGGLAMGLACSLMIFLFLKHEKSFDQSFSDHQNIFRVNIDYTGSGTTTSFVNSPPALAPGITGLFPGVKRVSRLRYAMRSLLRNGDRSFYENHGFYADSLFLEIFDYLLVSGDPSTSLDEPNSIVISNDLAVKYFGEADPMGKLIQMNSDHTLKVTGVLLPIPSNTHLKFDFLVSFPTYEVPAGYASDLASWSWLGFLTYVQLDDGTDHATFQSKLDQTFKQRTREGRQPYRTQVQPITDIYLGSNNMVDDLASHIRSGNSFTIYAMGLIALLILGIATFNFMNLSVAISINRSKEIGLRKVLGAGRGKLRNQLLTESLVIALMSMIISYGIAFLCFPLLRDFFQWEQEVKLIDYWHAIPLVFSVAVLIGVLAGIYPSIMLSNSQAIPALKGSLKTGLGAGLKLRNSLVVIQFSISVVLIASTIIIAEQVKYLRSQSLGFDKENVIVIKLLPQDLSRYYKRFKEILLLNSQVLSVSRSERLMGDPWPVNSILVDGQQRDQAKQVVGNLVGFDYLSTMGIQLKEGRSFSSDYAQDSLRSIILSESAVDHLGLADPIGQKVRFFSFDGPRTIIGVVKDFNFSKLNSAITPAVLIMPFIDLEHLYVRVSSGNVADQLDFLESSWDQMAPGTPLDIRFMDDHINRLYESEQQLAEMIGGFSGLAIILACLGLYGLVAFMVNNRIREVGIRKVLGASIQSLMILFSRQFLLLILLAAALSVPAIQYLMNLWLDDFAYRISIPLWTYFVSFLGVTFIALLTISQQTLNAALTNPVRVLRNE